MTLDPTSPDYTEKFMRKQIEYLDTEIAMCEEGIKKRQGEIETYKLFKKAVQKMLAEESRKR